MCRYPLNGDAGYTTVKELVKRTPDVGQDRVFLVDGAFLKGKYKAETVSSYE